ncbi:MAG: hypothetical protein GX660_17485 [Clostridiaceae bacterium]|nr:hypothetical protein [Clostridiaceae bacterium]
MGIFVMLYFFIDNKSSEIGSNRFEFYDVQNAEKLGEVSNNIDKFL